MFDIGIQELIIIFIVALLVVGPKKLPEVGRSLGRGIAELKRAMQGLKDSIEEEGEKIKKEIPDISENLLSPTGDKTPAEKPPKEKTSAGDETPAEPPSEEGPLTGGPLTGGPPTGGPPTEGTLTEGTPDTGDDQAGADTGGEKDQADDPDDASGGGYVEDGKKQS